MTFESASERGLRFVSFAATFMFVIGVLLTMADIFLRSVSTFTVAGMVDMMQLCVLTGAMLAIPHAFLSDQHVAIDLFVERAPNRVQLALRIIAAMLAIAFLCGVLWFSYQQALNEAHDRSQTIGIPMSWYWTPFLVGIALSVFANIVLMVQLWRHGLPAKAVE
ncbi:TRAP transporter small permease [Undibacter mobilis]|uniref:TRAP transporter small permease protein n=1 Tax=Undibacter mobilis TaxID=2292256 RepID=A0A371B8B3_9BRAD|nr:TRAP transporter small permease [Undibacter mobilis]RDV03810.1 TRAP transporter small permease [Undibacter mobilis]